MTLQEIKTIICEAFEIRESEFTIFKNHFSHSHARYAFCVLSRKYTLKTMKAIGETCCMDYTCVQRGITRHPFLMDNKRDYSIAFKKAEKELKEKTKQQ
jgi:chromosomal replication initiation ATPase DnaA